MGLKVTRHPLAALQTLLCKLGQRRNPWNVQRPDEAESSREVKQWSLFALTQGRQRNAKLLIVESSPMNNATIDFDFLFVTRASGLLFKVERVRTPNMERMPWGVETELSVGIWHRIDQL